MDKERMKDTAYELERSTMKLEAIIKLFRARLETGDSELIIASLQDLKLFDLEYIVSMVEKLQTLLDAKEATSLLTLEEVDMPTRCYNAFKRNGYKTLFDIARLSKKDAKKIRNLGNKGIEEMSEILELYGLDWETYY